CWSRFPATAVSIFGCPPRKTLPRTSVSASSGCAREAEASSRRSARCSTAFSPRRKASTSPCCTHRRSVPSTPPGCAPRLRRPVSPTSFWSSRTWPGRPRIGSPKPCPTCHTGCGLLASVATQKYGYTAKSRTTTSPTVSTRVRSPCPLRSSWASDASTERGQPRDGLPERQRVHLLGAFVGQHRLEVRHMPHHRVFQGNPVRAEHRAGGAGDVEGGADVGHLAEADVVVVQLPGVLQPPDLQRHQARPVDLDEQIGELALGQLEPGKRLAELLARERVVQCRLVARAP